MTGLVTCLTSDLSLFVFLRVKRSPPSCAAVTAHPGPPTSSCDVCRVFYQRTKCVDVLIEILSVPNGPLYLCFNKGSYSGKVAC